MPPDPLTLHAPTPADGPDLHRLAVQAGGLDVNSEYAYLLWARDFGATSVIARCGGHAVGFVTGFRRPVDPSCLFVWQVAVHPDHRRQGLGVTMLDALVDRTAPTLLETTVTPSNVGSARMFERLAATRGAEVERVELFGASAFDPDHDHEPEVLFTIGPLGPPDDRARPGR
jgi:L-2,4-diaminobutyric acid acetyltransferase